MQKSIVRAHFGFAMLFVVVAGSALADTTVTPLTEYRDRIKVSQTVQPLGDKPFGESVNLYKGGLSFEQTDISFPGIGPTITLARSYSIGGSTAHSYGFDVFGDWSLSIPRIETIIPGDRFAQHGEWKVGDSVSNSYARCSRFGTVSPLPFPTFAMPWWNGYQLVTPDGSTQPLLARTNENTIAPSTGTYNIVTTSNWMVSCLANTDNVNPSMPGEAFLAIAPDGTKYWFNHLVYGPPLATLIHEQDGARPVFLPRKMGYMYATRIEDRFGNFITYTYNAAGKPTGITGSDGRNVSLSWSGAVISSITMQPGTPEARTWSYGYSSSVYSPTLIRVVQPDASAWTFAMSGADRAEVIPDDQGCGSMGLDSGAPAPITITHPNGLVGVFNVGFRGFARTMVPNTCSGSPGSVPHDSIPVSYLAVALMSKSISGPGVASQTWTYNYSPVFGSSLTECPLPSSCPTTAWVEITAPDGSATRYTHLTRWGAQEGKLISVVSGITASNPVGLRTETREYASETQGPYPARYGINLDSNYLVIVNNAPIETVSPAWRMVISQQNVTFNRTIGSFDKFVNPLSSTSSSSGNAGGDSSKTESFTYANDTAKWVLGQVASVTDVATGKVISQTDYDATTDLPWRRYSFGILQQTLAYNADGTLATATDGRGNVTALGDWVRGIPQHISYPTGVSQWASVNSIGSIVVTADELGSSTNYGYDPMGRLSAINYPTGDTTAWNALARGFVQVFGDEYGLLDGHWKQTVSTGNGRTTTFYDARWNPVVTLTQDTAIASSLSVVLRRFDAMGREVFTSYPVDGLATISDALPGVTTRYDALGRAYRTEQDSELGPLVSNTTEYLPGFQTRVTNARGFQTTTSYQVFDSPDTSRPVLIQAPEGVTTTITRDVFGKLTQISRSGGG